MSNWNNYNPLGSASDAFDAMDKLNKARTADEALKQTNLLEEQNRLLKEGNKGSAKDRELAALFQRYKCSCYDRRQTGSLPNCKCCGGQPRHVKLSRALEATGKDTYSSYSKGRYQLQDEGIVFLGFNGQPEDVRKTANHEGRSEDRVLCPRCNGTGKERYNCENCEDTGIPNSRRAAYLQERQSIENRYMYQN